MDKSKKKKANPLSRSQVAAMGAKASPWSRTPGCLTARAQKSFKQLKSTPHPDEKKPK